MLALDKQHHSMLMERGCKKQIQVEQDKIETEMINAKHEQDKEILKQQKKDAAKHYKEIWNAQKDLAEQTAAADRAF